MENCCDAGWKELVLKTCIFVKTLNLNVDSTDAGHWSFPGHQSMSGSLYTSKLRHNSCTS